MNECFQDQIKFELLFHRCGVYLPQHRPQHLHRHDLDGMPALVAVTYFAFLMHFCYVAAAEDEHSGSILVVCLAVAAAA